MKVYVCVYLRHPEFGRELVFSHPHLAEEYISRYDKRYGQGRFLVYEVEFNTTFLLEEGEDSPRDSVTDDFYLVSTEELESDP